MADFSIKAHDRVPSIVADLTYGPDKVPLDLTNATAVTFIMRPTAGGAVKVNAAAVIVDPPTSGRVRYDWAAADTTTPDKYQAEWEIIWTGNLPQTVPTESYHSVEVLADLDGAA